MNMYSNWEEQALSSLTTIKWFSIAEVISYLDNLRRFIILTPGKLSEVNMPMLHREIKNDIHNQSLPARQNKRFPDSNAYVCEAIGDWGLKLDNLALISSVMVNTNRLKRGYSHINSPGDLEQFALEMIHELRRMVQDRVDFVNRQTFEARYGLGWTSKNAQILQESALPDNGHYTNNVKTEESLCNSGELGQSKSSGPTTPLDSNKPDRSPTNGSDNTIDLTNESPS
ncbi:hypothetical protein BD408DRAFT_409108 [Parasitella parasitica]|nr:hypothetical protein BD408DRAFT_409108 [Parasitella parasitica]